MTKHSIDGYTDIISFEDVTDRVEELEESTSSYEYAEATHANHLEEVGELAELVEFLRVCVGEGGDHQWRGDWYPGTAIRDAYFRTHAEELAHDIGAIPADAPWPNRHIDWEAAAEELKQDYTSVQFDGSEYWIR